MKISVYGEAPDLIRLEGDIEDQFDVDGPDNLIVFSNGTVLRLSACEATWRATVLWPGTGDVSIEDAAVVGDDCDSDLVVLQADVQWVALSQELRTPPGDDGGGRP